jgi:threonine dehydratase
VSTRGISLEAVKARVTLKIERVNPIRSFKGRGACYYAHLHETTAPTPWVCASAGNFGQGLAYAARARGIPLLFFAAESANPMKVARMRSLGAERAGTFVEDGRGPAIPEGAGALTLAAAHRERFRGRSLLLVVGGGNLDERDVNRVLCGG